MEKKNIVGLLKVLLLGLGVCLAISILNPRMAMSAWSNDPTPVCNASGNQYGLRLIKVADGYIVVWQDERRVYRDIYVQKFDVDGNMGWIGNGRVVAAGNNGEASNHLLYNSQSLSGIVSDTQGGAIALWTEDYSCQSGPCGNAWITRVNSNGDVQWGMPPSPGVTIQGTDTAVLLNQHGHADAIAPDGEGGAFGIIDVDAWGDWYVFRMDATGAYRSVTSNTVGARGRAQMIYGGHSNGKDYVNIAWWDYGDFSINIEDPEVNYPASADTLYALWNRITLTTTPSWWSEPSIISDGAGGAIVVWEDGRNDNFDVFAQKISADGSVQWTPNGVPIAVQPGNQRRPQLVSDGAGGAVVVWDDSRTSPTRVYAQHVGADGNTLWAANGIPISSIYGESPKIIRSDDGASIIVWFDTDHDGGTKDYLRAQKIDTAGSLLWPPDSRTPFGGTTGVVISEMYGADFDIASDGGRGLIAVWNLLGDIYAKRVAPTIDYNPVTISFFAAYGNTNPPGQTLTISNTGCDILEWSVDGNAPWLTLYPTSGIDSGTVTASVNISGLLPGTYDASITITGIETTNSPITIPVTLTINPPPRMILLTPNGGEVIPSGSTYRIGWLGPAEAVKFKLKYSLDNGLTWTTVHRESYVTGTEYLWEVPKPLGNKRSCLVKIIGYSGSDKKIGVVQSDSPFSIEVVRLTSPNGGDFLISKQAHRITWATNQIRNPVAKVKLYYTKDGGTTWPSIKGAVPGNPGYYDWTPSVGKTKSKCKVKVVLMDAAGNSLGSDLSDGYFTISPSP
jgi:hypothetical protein